MRNINAYMIDPNYAILYIVNILLSDFVYHEIN